MSEVGPFEVQIVRGAPIEVYGRTLTPVARVVVGRLRRGTIHEESVDGWGWAVRRVYPIQIRERRAGVERVLPVCDATKQVLRRMSVIAVTISVVAVILILANRLSRR
jgi:hypothetical protein